MARLYRKYNETLLKNNGMDFDDLIFLAIRLLESHPEIREVFSSGFRYVLIDEYQDTNKAQYRLIRLLVGAHHNLVAVGDDDQSIYGWRGADIGNILSFRNDFPEAHVTKLEQNYRSTANILGVAASVIRNNKNRMDKTIWTANPPGEKISLLELDDELLEAAWVARRILAQSAFKPGDTAVFYRTNAQSRVLEDELRRQRIPYLIVGGTRFYERREVKDLMAYLRVLSNPQDSASLARILNVPKRGIGDKSIRTVELYAAENGISLFDGLRRARASGLADAAAKRILEFTILIDTLRALAAQEPLPALIAEIINRTGYKAHLEDEGTEEALDRLANVEELVSAAQDFLRRRADGEIEAARDPDAAEAERFQRALELKFPLPGMEPGPAAGGLADEAADGGPAEGRDAAAPSLDFFGDALPGGDSGRNASVTQAGPEPGSPEAARLEDLDLFLQEISLLADTDGLKATQEAVTLMTVHSAKGLEFPRVFVTGLEDGLFPMLREEDEDEVEEERRLFYVAATRARKELSLTYARRRRRYGLYQESHGSRFLGEIDRKFLEIARPSLPPSPFARAADREARSWGGYGGYSGGYGGGGSRGTSGFAGRDGESHGVSSTPAYEDFSQEQEEGFRKGQKVAHDKFGEGTVVATDGHGDSARVHVMFADHVRRVLMVKFAKLKTLAR
jgi:DNA helicase-2/ATP-dependent DNA helicase PcrA